MISILMMGLIFFFAALFGMGIWFVTKLSKRATYIADIFEERADGQIILLTAGIGIKVLRKPNEIEKWQIVGSKIDPFQPKGREKLIPYLKKGIDKVYLLRDKDGFFHAMGFDIDKENQQIILKPEYKNQMDWIVKQLDERAKIKEKRTKWGEYTPAIALVMSFMIFFVAIYFTYDYANKQLTRSTDVLNRIDAKEKEFDQKYNINALINAQQIIQQNQVATQTQNWTQTTVTVP